MIRPLLVSMFLYPFLALAELNPVINQAPDILPGVVQSLNEMDDIQGQVPFDNVTQKSFDIKDIAIVENVQIYGEDNSLAALRMIKESANQHMLSLAEQDKAFNKAAGLNYPTWRNPIKSNFLEDVSVSVGTGNVSVSLPLMNSNDLDEDQKAELLIGLKELRDIYESSDASQGQKYLIEKYFDYYFDFNISRSADQILTDNIGTSVESKAILMAIRDGNQKLGESIMDHIEKTLDKALIGERKIITTQNQILVERIVAESEDLKDLVLQANNGIYDGVASANEKLDYLKKKEIENELIQKISNTNNADELKKIIEDSEKCSSADLTSACLVSKEKIPFMKAKHSKLKQIDIRTTTKNGLLLAQDVALLVNDKKTAGYIAKSIQGYDAVVKISDLATGIAGKTAMASAGDVMAMASLAISVSSIFSSGGGPSADELILKQLRLIRMDIEALRKQMHERFDLLSTDIRQMGFGLNLKLDIMSENISVVANNQSLILELINNNSLMIADLARVQSNNSIVEIARSLDINNKRIQSWNDPEKITEVYLNDLTEFSSYLEYNNFDSLLWSSVSQKNNYEIASPEALVLTSNLNSVFSQSDLVSYGLIDYLIKNSVANNLGGLCTDLNFNEVYLFNVLGSKVLESLRAEFEELPKGSTEYSKFSYVLKAQAEGQLNISKLLSGPIQAVDKVFEKANRCLNDFAVIKNKSSESDSVNFVTYLLEDYSKILSKELLKVKKLLTSEFHLKNLFSVIQSPDSKYLKGSQDKLTNVSSQFPERRLEIDLSVIDFSKPIKSQSDKLDQIFYEKYKTISICARDGLRVGQKKTPKDRSFNPSDYPSIELPKKLLFSVFSNFEMRSALALDLNSISICFSPISDIDLPILFYNDVFDERYRSLLLNGFRDSIQGMILSIDSINNPEIEAKSYKDKKHPNVNIRTVTSKIEIYFPLDEIRLSKLNKAKALDLNVLNLSEAPLGKPIKPSYFFLHNTEFNKYVSTSLGKADWKCKNNEITGFVDQCFVKGKKPSDLQLEFENVTSGYWVTGSYLFIYGRFNELIDVDKSNNFRTHLKAEGVMKSLDVIQQDYMKCYYRTLLGYSSCEFSKTTSNVPEAERVDWTRLNQLESILKSIVPKFAVFKKDVKKEDKLRFNNMFNQLLNSPAYSVVRLSQDETLSAQSFFAQLAAELESQGLGLSELVEKSEGLLEIDIEKLLNKEVYSGLNYYQELSK